VAGILENMGSIFLHVTLSQTRFWRRSGSWPCERMLFQAAKSRELPEELQIAILDYLGGEKASLGACTLLCKAWLHAAQSQLFRHMLISPLFGDPNDFSFFLRKTPHIARSIRGFHIHDVPHRMCDFTVEYMASLLGSLPSLQTLILTETHLTYGETRPGPILGSKFTLHKLVVNGIMNTISTLHKLLSLFSSITELRIVLGKGWLEQTDSDPKSCLDLHLSSLIIYSQHTRIGTPFRIAPWFSQRLTKLETGLVNFPPEDDYGSIISFIHHFGPHLSHLSLDYRWLDARLAECYKSLDISCCTSLYSLRLAISDMVMGVSVLDGDDITFLDFQWRWVTDFLSKVSHSTVQEIKISIEYAMDLEPGDPTAKVDWENLRVQLGQFKNPIRFTFQTVEFPGYYPIKYLTMSESISPLPDKWVEKLKEELSSFVARGLVYDHTRQVKL